MVGLEEGSCGKALGRGIEKGNEGVIARVRGDGRVGICGRRLHGRVRSVGVVGG